MFLIPILIIILIIGFSFGGNLLKDQHISLSDIFSFPFSQTNEKKSPAPAPSPTKQTPSKTTTRAPPAPLPAKQTTQIKSASVPPSYFQKIKISSAQATKDNQPSLITLRPNFYDEGNINITGWKIKSIWLGEFKIPLGIKAFHPSFNAQPAEQILVGKSDTIYLKGQASPFGRGGNFRTNTCFGYLKTYYPNLPGSYSCYQEKPKIEEIKNLAPQCQEFILNKIDYAACKAPDHSSDIAVATNKECVTYITSVQTGFYYEGCYQKHSKDPNFLSNEWHIYMDTTFGNSLHDSITLYDSNGLIVDTYTY